MHGPCMHRVRDRLGPLRCRMHLQAQLAPSAVYVRQLRAAHHFCSFILRLRPRLVVDFAATRGSHGGGVSQM